MNFKKEADKLYSRLDSKEVGGEVCYFRPRRVYPILDLDGNVNWKNFIKGAGWKSWAIALLICLVTLGVAYEYNSNLKQCSEILSEINLNITNLSMGYPKLPEDFNLTITKSGEDVVT